MVLAIVAAVGLSLLIAFEGPARAIGLQGLAILVLLTVFLLGFLVAKSTKEGVWSSPFLFLVILALFHGGLLITPAFGGEIAEFLSTGWTGWYTADLMASASYLIELGLVSYGFAVGCWAWWHEGESSDGGVSSVPVTRESAILQSALVDVGAVVLLGSILYWYLASASATGPLFFLQSYGAYRLDTVDTSLGNAYLGISLGAVLVAQNPRRPLAAVSVVAFVGFILLALAIGLRSPALIPVVASIAVYARGHRMPSKGVFVAVLIVGLMGISAVQQIRADGLAGFSLSSLSASPIKAIEEMGYSARVVVTSVDWHEVSGDPYRNGATYWAPIERGLSALIGVPRIDAESDFRLMNVEIASRVGQIGGSIIAEGHHNFGPPGVVMSCFLAGLVLSATVLRRRTPANLAMGGLAMVLLLMHVRNSFAPLIAWSIAGLLVILAARMLAWTRLHGARA